jgi:ANTAR domain
MKPLLRHESGRYYDRCVGQPVEHENLLAGSGRWPSFSTAAIKAGFQSAVALPLRLRDATFGALNLLSVRQTPMVEADIIVARAFADLATVSIVQHRTATEAQRLNEQLSAALTSRVVIEQAKGVIAERAGIDLAEAFSRLRRYARNRNLRLTDVAEAAIVGSLDPEAWAPAPFGPSDLVGKPKSRPTAYDELAELATRSALAKWLQRWQPIAIHSAVLAGARMESITGALGNSMQVAVVRCHRNQGRHICGDVEPAGSAPTTH